MFRKVCLVILVIAFTGVLAGCGDYLTGDKLDNDPNRASEVTLSQVLTNVTANITIMLEGHMAKTAGVWVQQWAGTDAQFIVLNGYEINEQEHNAYFQNFYDGGGLIDIRRGQTMAAEAGDRVYAGIFKAIEGLFLSQCASLWGDIPYSEAASDVAEPKLDDQSDVYAALQIKLDEAIVDLAGAGAGPGAVDVFYGGNVTKWIALCHSVKARLYLHWAKVNQATNLAAALAQAQMGILDATGAGDMLTAHNATNTEGNIWFQFTRDRSGNMRANTYMVNLLLGRNDPRGLDYYENIGGTIVGAHAGNHDGNASNVNPDTWGSAGWSSPLVTYEETQFIIAEAQYKLNGNEAAAITAVHAALDKIWTVMGYDVADKPSLTGLTGTALWEEIMMQKYIAMFTNIEVWADYKRTSLPAIVPCFKNVIGDGVIPRRLLYGNNERIANSNIPEPDVMTIYIRNENDPDVVY